MEDRHIRLLRLKEIIETNSDNFSLILAVEKYFFGGETVTGNCKCKMSTALSKLYQFWIATGKSELEGIEAEIERLRIEAENNNPTKTEE
jgi:hypothetical protein